MNDKDLSMAETNVWLEVEVTLQDATVRLFQGDTCLESVLLDQPRELAERLLPVVDTLLSHHGIQPSEIRKFDVRSDLPEGYSSRRIAETVAQVWVAALKA